MSGRRRPIRAPRQTRQPRRLRHAADEDRSDNGRGLVAAVVLLAAAAAAFVAVAVPLPRRIIGRDPNAHRERRAWGPWRDSLSERNFRLRYACGKETFAKLADELRAFIEPKSIALRSGHTAERAIGCEVRLAVTLRFLRGGSYLDIADTFMIEQSTVWDIIWGTIAAMAQCEYLDNIKMAFKDDPAAQARVALGFAPPGDIFEGLIAGAVDGTLIGIKSSDRKHVCYKSLYVPPARRRAAATPAPHHVAPCRGRAVVPSHGAPNDPALPRPAPTRPSTLPSPAPAPTFNPRLPTPPRPPFQPGCPRASRL